MIIMLYNPDNWWLFGIWRKYLQFVNNKYNFHLFVLDFEWVFPTNSTKEFTIYNHNYLQKYTQTEENRGIDFGREGQDEDVY